MKILVACDKYKGSLDAFSVCKIIAESLEVSPQIQCIQQPLADGGDGTLEILQKEFDLRKVEVDTIDPLGRRIMASYFTKNDTAYVELAQASGITRLDHSELNVMATTTLGTGRLMKHALDSGYKNVVLAIGGSCTNEMGLGIAHELGYRFQNNSGQELIPSGGTLLQIAEIIPPSIFSKISLTILCDVNNPLYGPQGSAQIYGPQKGARTEDIISLDKGTRSVAALIFSQFGKEVSTMNGAGAAGGIAAGLYGLLPQVEVRSGFEFLSQVVNLENKIRDANVVISGEGGLENNSFDGKVIGRIHELCQKHSKPLFLVVGNNSMSKKGLDRLSGIKIYDLISRADSLKDAMDNAEKYLGNISADLRNDLPKC